MYQAVFLDRDGVINRERSDYVKSWTEFEFLPHALPALARLATLDCPILVASNQSAIGRGLVTSETIADIHKRLSIRVVKEGGRIDGFYVCPHRPDEGCNCRKPRPGLLLQAAQELNLDLSRCVFVGDSITDLRAAEAAGCECILVRSGRRSLNHSEITERHRDIVIENDLAAAVSAILGRDI